MTIPSSVYVVFWVDPDDPTETLNSPPVGPEEAKRMVKSCLDEGDEQIMLARYRLESRGNPAIRYGIAELEEEE